MTTTPPDFDALPPAWADPGLAEQNRRAIAASGRVLVALDDDPTGVQTVHETPVLARWTVEDLAAELAARPPVFFILTNSRSLPEAEASDLTREIVTNLHTASEQTGVPVAIASRSDSTLRGHFPAETDAIQAVTGAADGVVLVPAFFEGGRITVDDVHWVRQGDEWIPAAETEFAKDATFGFTSVNMGDWVTEKTGGRIQPEDVASLDIRTMREGGPVAVAAFLKDIHGGTPVIVNAASYEDLDVVVAGILEAEAAGKRFVYRTAASFVRARAGLPARDLLTREELLGANAPTPLPGLVIAGSHVQKTTEQLAHCQNLPGTTMIEVSVPALIAGDTSRDEEVRRVASDATSAIEDGRTAIVATSRRVERPVAGGDGLALGRTASAALVAIVHAIEAEPGWVVGKGGITSSDIGTKGLGAHRAMVLGQVRPGVPVWRLGEESRFPGLPYVVFPGNVGDPETLAEVVAELQGS
ncbi:MAG: four-carbon acid sugar kinase family protein [Thermomicrobiales bacterium]